MFVGYKATFGHFLHIFLVAVKSSLAECYLGRNHKGFEIFYVCFILRVRWEG